MPFGGEDEFDFDAFDAEFEAEYEENGDEEVVVPEQDAVLDEEITPSEDDVVPEPNGDEEVAPPSREVDQSKHDASFAQMRRERDEARKESEWIQAMAKENGTSVEEMRSRYEQAKLANEAEEKGVPVEFLQRQTQTERELAELKEQSFNERFNSSVDATIAKYNVTTDELEQTFAYARQEGLVNVVKQGALSFDALHRLAHLESFTDKKVQSALQDNLAQKKKRQSEAPIGNGATSSPDGVADLDALVDKDVKEALANW